MDSAETQARLDKLTVEADTLAEAVRVLTVTADRITKRTRRSETVIACLVVSFVLDIVLTVFVAFGFVNLNNATQTIQQTQANGAVVRQDVLCPLYHLILQSYSTEARDHNPLGPAWYDNAFATLRNGNAALHCAH